MIARIELTMRSSVIRTLAAETQARGGAGDAARLARGQGQRQRAAAVSTAPVSAMHDALGGSPLDPRLTFDSFVVGRSNTLAHAAAKQVGSG